MKRLMILSVALFYLLGLKAQVIDSTIGKYAANYSQERAYLHYDKSSYAAGETVWFKAYLMDGILAADESKSFYVDWSDEKGNILAHNVHPVVEATTNGQFAIPVDYTGEYIHVKAYTKWMLNFDSAFLYNKDIRIIRKSTTAAAKVTITPSIQFFPEGGDATVSINGKIAFKANDQWGRPVKVRGIIQNSKSAKLDSIVTRHDGMGYFYLKPEPGETYVAKWKDEQGKEYTTALPVAKASGVSLQVALSAGNKRTVTITASPELAATLGTVNVLGTMHQQQAFKVAKDLSLGTAKAIIPVKDLPSGILVITVFDANWKPLAERITFVNNEEYLFQPTVEVQHWGLSKRARNEVEVTVPDNGVANLSVSVTDVDIDSDSSNTIISHLLLTSDIKGQVYKPSYYFSSINDTVSQHLDLVMLTHGWRRFKWDDVAQGKFPKISYQRDTSYLVLSGRVYGATPAQLRDAGDVVLLVKPKTGEGQTFLLPVKSNGTFEDPSVILFDSVQVYYQLSKKKGLGDASIQFMEGLLPALRSTLPASRYFSNQSADTAGNFRHFLLASQAADAVRRAEGLVLSNVVVTSKTKSTLQIMDEKYSSGLFAGGDGYKFDLVNDPLASTSLNIFQYLQGKVAGLQINSSGNNTTLLWRGGSPQLFLDEMRTDVDMVSTLSVSDIAFVKVMRPPFFGGGNSGNGAIAIYTRRGDDAKAAPGKGLAKNLVRGYTEIRQFYSPNYSTFKPENEQKDIRTTIYWNPLLKTTPQNGKIKLTFYNNDITRAFRIVIEGMTESGRLTHIEQILE